MTSTPTRQSDRPFARGCRACHGFTLPEVLIASTILAMTVGALVYPFSLAYEHQQRDAAQTTAAALAGQMIERLVSLPYDDVVAMNGRVESGSQITDVGDQPIGDASLAGFELAVAANEVKIPVGDETPEEAATFCVAEVVVTHDLIEPVTVGRLFAAPSE